MLVWSKKKYYRQPKQNSWINAVSFLLIIVMVCVYGGGMHSGGHMIQNVFFKQNESPGCIHACRHWARRVNGNHGNPYPITPPPICTHPSFLMYSHLPIGALMSTAMLCLEFTTNGSPGIELHGGVWIHFHFKMTFLFISVQVRPHTYPRP